MMLIIKISQIYLHMEIILLDFNPTSFLLDSYPRKISMHLAHISKQSSGKYIKKKIEFGCVRNIGGKFNIQ